MSRCRHGTVIHESWEECWECRKEEIEYDDGRKESEAAQKTAEEAAKQTELLRQIAADSKRSKNLEEENRRLKEEIERLKKSQ